MMSNTKTAYQRILLKLSGEALKGSCNFGIDPNMLDRMSRELKDLLALGTQVGVVIGGGNLFRGAGLAKMGMNRVVGDHMGMLATVMNGLAMSDALRRIGVDVRLMSAIPLDGICSGYDWMEAISLLSKGCIVIFSAGIGNPFFTTDSAACLRAIETESDTIFKATRVDGVYSDDPSVNPSAMMYDKLTYEEVLKKELQVMDLAAFTLARDYNLPIHIFNINKPGVLYKILQGEKEGTLISS
jgi:uridylate kinase